MKKNMKAIGIVLGILVCGLLVGIGMYFLFGKEKEEKLEDLPKPIMFSEEYSVNMVDSNPNLEYDSDYQGVYQKQNGLILENINTKESYTLNHFYEDFVELANKSEVDFIDYFPVEIDMQQLLQRNSDYEKIFSVRDKITCYYDIFDYKLTEIECENENYYFLISFRFDHLQ